MLLFSHRVLRLMGRRRWQRRWRRISVHSRRRTGLQCSRGPQSRRSSRSSRALHPLPLRLRKKQHSNQVGWHALMLGSCILHP